MSKYDVLVTGAESHQGMVVINSLASHGVKMLVTGDSPNSIGFFSRKIAGRKHLPSPISGKEQFVEQLLDTARREKIPYIFPVTESSLIALDEHRSEVDSIARLMAPPSATIKGALDKKLTLEIAVEHGVPTTNTCYPDSLQEAEDFAARHGYPIIVKPRSQASNARVAGSFDFKVEYCHNLEELRAFLRQFEGKVFPMIQDYAYGPHTQFMAFVENGNDMHSCFQDWMVRMLPITGGVGARRLSREIDEDIREQSHRIFSALDWEGVAQTQWKGPGPDGKYRFIEVSVRIIASIGSVTFSGVDHPWMNYQYFSGQKVDRVDSYKLNNPSRWFRGDCITVARYLLNDTPTSADELPSKTSVFFSWLYDFVRPGLKNDVESFTDPMPGVVEFGYLLRDLFGIVNRKAKQLLAPLFRRHSP